MASCPTTRTARQARARRGPYRQQDAAQQGAVPIPIRQVAVDAARAVKARQGVDRATAIKSVGRSSLTTAG